MKHQNYLNSEISMGFNLIKFNFPNDKLELLKFELGCFPLIASDSVFTFVFLEVR